MGCRSDYMEPGNFEKECQRAGKLYCYALKALGYPGQDKRAKEISQSEYALSSFRTGPDDYCVMALCSLLRGCTEEEVNRVVYNPKDRVARDLANWWEDHQEADRIREEKEKAKAERKKVPIQTRIVDAVLEDLASRKGLDDAWDDISKSVQDEIRLSLKKVVTEILTDVVS
jgi:phosphoglycolate phosphatase-like HAD superfamily hydrolase